MPLKKGKKLGILEISRRTGISAAHVSKIFSGKRRPSLTTAAKLATVKGITMDELYMELYEIGQRLEAAHA